MEAKWSPFIHHELNADKTWKHTFYKKILKPTSKGSKNWSVHKLFFESYFERKVEFLSL